MKHQVEVKNAKCSFDRVCCCPTSVGVGVVEDNGTGTGVPAAEQ